MEYRKLGASGLNVSPICLGAMMFGDRTGAAEAGRIVRAAFDAGINFIDTADVYARGESERIVGRLVKGERSRWVLATKVGGRMYDDPNSVGLSRKWIMRALDESLGRLGTDYVDLYYFHRDDHETPLQESIGAIGTLIAQGKIRYFGLSNYQGWRIAEVVALCRSMGVPQPVALQPYYNAMKRQPEVEMFPACRHFGLGVVPYSPLARGVLTGKYLPDAKPAPGTRAGRSDRRLLETEFRPESLRLAQKLKTHAEKRGMTAGQFALRWVLNSTTVTSVLAGPRTLAQWREYLGALGHGFDAADEALVDRLVAPGHASTPGYTDPKFPVTGRAPQR
jgi:aryl-alcohol dehydrogenase (NADP+)